MSKIRIPTLPTPDHLERELIRTLARADELRAMLRVSRRQAKRLAADSAARASQGAAHAR